MAGHIYLVTNNLNGKQYVGQTIVAKNKVGHGHLVTAAYKKHGKSSFSYEIICNGIENRNTLNFIEKFWIKVMDCRYPNGYNIEHGGSTTHKFGKETSKKLSKSKLGRVLPDAVKAKISASHKGLKHTDESKAKISLARKKQVFSEETKQKLSEAAKRQWAKQRGEI